MKFHPKVTQAFTATLILLILVLLWLQLPAHQGLGIPAELSDERHLQAEDAPSLEEPNNISGIERREPARSDDAGKQSNEGVLLWVTSDTGESLVRATATVVSPPPMGQIHSRSSDAEGILSIERALAEGAVITVAHDQYATQTLRMPAVPAELYEVSLRQGASIAGRVEMSDGATPPDQAQVFIWSAGYEIGYGSAGASYPGCGGRYSVEISADGSFLATGLEHGGIYGITAYGGGVVVPNSEEVTGVRAPGAGITLTCKYLYGAVVRPDSIDQNFVAFMRNLAPKGLSIGNSNAGHVEVYGEELGVAVKPNNWSLMLAGMSPSHKLRTMLPRYILRAVHMPTTSPMFAEMTLNLPVVSAKTGPFRLQPPLADGTLFEASLSPVGKLPPTGGLSMYIGHEGEDLDFYGGRRIPVQIQLQLLDSGGYELPHAAFRFNAAWDKESGCYVANSVLPGTYKARIVFRETALVLPNLGEEMPIVSVVSNEMAMLPIEAPPLGVLHVSVAQVEQGTYTGAARVMVMRQQERGGYVSTNPDDFIFDRPPFSMGPFEAKDYHITVDLANGRATGLEPVSITISEGVNHYQVNAIH